MIYCESLRQLWYTVSMATTPDHAASSIINIAFSDSHVRIDRKALTKALNADFHAGAGRYPTDEECDELVTGGEDGEPDPDLCETFSVTAGVIASYWE